MRKVGMFIVMFLVLLGLGLGKVLAGCEVIWVECTDPETGEDCSQWYDGCGGNWDYCESGEYLAPDGSCNDIGEEGDDGGGGGYSYTSCPGGQVPTGGIVYLPGANFTCMTPGSCNSWFPSSGAGGECQNTRQDCNIQQLCCAPGQAVECGDIVSSNDVLPGDSKYDGYKNCPGAGSARVAAYLNNGDPVIYCRSGCKCVTPCGTRPGTTKTCGYQNQGNYTILTFHTPTSCVVSTDNTSYDDVYVTHYDSSVPYMTYKDEDGQWITEYYKTTVCRKRTYVCTCSQTCISTAPTNLSVTQGESATAVMFTWRSGTGGTSQIIYVGTNQNSVNNDCAYGGCIISGAVLSPFYANSNFSYPVTGLSANTTYYFRVVTHENSSCRPSATVSYTTPDLTLSGRVYLDTNNNCSTATPWSLGGLTVTVRGTAYTGSVGSDGRFAFYGGTGNPISYLDLAGFGSAYTPSTATGCNAGSSLTSVANPSSTNYYYLTSLREAWWQARGAGVYANGNIRSELPSVAENLIEAGVGGELGALMRTSGSVDTGAGAVSTEGYTALTRYRGKIMNYDFFAAQLGVTPNTVNDWAADTMNKPTNNPDKVFYYLNPSGSEASVSTPWVVGSGESYIVLINGDLRIASNITVADGGFLAFIVNGSVRVSPAVTDIAGIFDIDGVMITESNGSSDVAADFEGSVVAWGGVSLGRDLGANNSNTPGESFSYRPDLLVNMPEAMKVFALKWEEVVPGTF